MQPAIRVALVPLDDRPVNLQDVQLAGTVAGAEVTAPPRYRLGRLDQEGDADGIAEWLDALDVAKVDAVIVSTDMLAYGGWRASRRPDPGQERVLRRIDAISRLKARRKALRIYAFSTLLGLSLADDGRKGAWKDALQHWAELGGSSAPDPKAASEAKDLEAQIPTTMLERYRQARARNLAVTKAGIDLAANGTIDFLAVGSDEDTPRGVATADRAAIAAAISAPAVDGRAAFVPGTDEIATLLLARAVGQASGAGRRVTMEILPALKNPGQAAATLSQTIDSLLVVSGATPAGQSATRDLTCLVYTGRDDSAQSAAASDRAAKILTAGGRVVIADIAIGGGDGAAVPLVEALRVKHVFQRLSGYAAGVTNTTLASALAQGLLRNDGAATADARAVVLLHRLAVDFVYQSVVRPQALDDYLAPHSIDPAHLDPDQVLRTELYLANQVKPLVENLIGDVTEPGARKVRAGPLAVRDVDGFKFKLPWGRLDEAEISFTLK